MTIASVIPMTSAPPAQAGDSGEDRPAIPPFFQSLRHHAVLVADGHGPHALGALLLAHAIEQRYGAIPRVIEPDDVTADAIVQIAREHEAALIALGLPRRRLLTPHWSSRRTTLALMQHARIPVLAVVPDLRGLPRRAVVGIDFGPASIRAARAALDLLARPVSQNAALLRLVYVDDRRARERRTQTGASAVMSLGTRAAFDWLIDALDVPAHVRVDACVRDGTVARELLRFAAETEADLIAIGTPHHSARRHLTWHRDAWRVAGPLLQDGRCSVLAVPPF